MCYAVYTRSSPGDIHCKADQEQYHRCCLFACRFHLDGSLLHYSDTLKVPANGTISGIACLLEDIRQGRVWGVIVEDASLLTPSTARLVKILDFFAAHRTRLFVVKETISCPIR